MFRWGAPERLLSDQGREFVAKINDAICNELGIKRSVTSAYHPQTNGLDERTNQTLKVHLAKLNNEKQRKTKGLVRVFGGCGLLHQNTKASHN